MAELTPEERLALIKRRGHRSDGAGKRHRASNLEVHHRDRNTHNNDSRNLRPLTAKEHQDLHRRRRG